MTDIRIVKDLSDAEKKALLEWGPNIWGTEIEALTWRPKTLHLVGYVGSVSVSKVSILRTEVEIGDEKLVIGGIGGVVTVPEAQGQGHAGELMRAAIEHFRNEWQVDAGMLFCLPRLAPYYAGQGWQEVDSPVLVDQPGGRQPPAPVRVMVLPLARSAWPDGPVVVPGLPW